MTQKILVWDIPTRLFHWLFALTFLVSFASAESEKFRLLHITSGYIFVAMLLVRLLWGLVGTRYARFTSFVRGPSAVMAYVKHEFLHRPENPIHTPIHRPIHTPGHNPLGAIAIVLMLFLGLVIGFTGGLNDFATMGFSWLHFWTESMSERATELHEGAGNLMMLVVLGHWCGVAWGRYRYGKGFIRAMITGYQDGDAKNAISRAYPLVGVLMLILAAYIVWLLCLS